MQGLVEIRALRHLLADISSKLSEDLLHILHTLVVGIGKQVDNGL